MKNTTFEEVKKIVFEEIKNDLSDNYQIADGKVLTEILDDVIELALHLSNRKPNANNLKLLKIEIKRTTKTIYLQRGKEDVTSISESGRSSNFDNAIETLSKNIIKNRKRLNKF